MAPKPYVKGPSKIAESGLGNFGLMMQSFGTNMLWNPVQRLTLDIFRSFNINHTGKIKMAACLIETSLMTTTGVLMDGNLTNTAPAPTLLSSLESSDMTIALDNQYGASVSISFGSNVGAPPPRGDPTATVLSDASSTQYTFPTGWAGRIYIGPDLNPFGSKVEGSIIGPPDVDVSFVDGYGVPITCSAGDDVVAGCNIDLFEQTDVVCPDLVEGPTCLNPAQNIPGGPAHLFFAACAGAAYTFPEDDAANAGGLETNFVSCCVGTSCKAPSRQVD